MFNRKFEAGGSRNAPEAASGEPRFHGGNIHRAATRYDIAEKNIIDFSSTVNPLGPSSSALRAARRSLASAGRYPDPDMTRLRAAISRYFGIKPEQVACGSGSNSLLHLIPRVFRPKKVLIPSPTYSEYAVAAVDVGAEVVPLHLQERTGFRIDPLDLAFSVRGVDMAFLCNPNNPTGLLIPKAEVLEIAQYALEQGARLVVDEAFMDFAESESVIKEAVHARHLICVRTFTTFFGLPGLRVGYAVSDEATIAALKAGQEPWSVNVAAESAAIAALHDWRHSRKTLRLVQKERERLLSTARTLPGVEIFPGSANFIFVKTPDSKSGLTEKLALRGLLVRDCSSFPGLDDRFLRIVVRTGRENKRLLRTLRELLDDN